MDDYNPWDSGCTGCAQEAMMKEYRFNQIKQQAEQYAKENKVDVVIYMELQEWKFIHADAAFSIGLVGRQIIRHSALALS